MYDKRLQIQQKRTVNLKAMSHHTILAIKCVRDSILQLTEKRYIHKPVYMTKLINIYQ